VWPEIKDWFGDGNSHIRPNESLKDESVATMLDRSAGIDAWLVGSASQVQGLASRVQWCATSWDSFTVRYELVSGRETEYAKRKAAIETEGALYPLYTVHAYVTEPRREGNLLSVAMIRTRDLIEVCDWIVGQDYPGNWNWDRQYGIRKVNNAKFIFAMWKWLKREWFDTSDNNLWVHQVQPPKPLNSTESVTPTSACEHPTATFDQGTLWNIYTDYDNP